MTRTQVHHFHAMGTDVEIIVVGGTGRAAIEAQERVDHLERLWSRFLDDSELSRLNAAAPAPVMVSSITFELVQRALEAWRRTDGRFDPTVLSALEAAGYDRTFEDVAPDVARDVEPARPAPGCEGIELDPVVRAVRLPPGVRLDLGGIGKGFAADLVAMELRAAGAAGACVNLGGDLRVSGEPPDGAPAWVVAVDDPAGAGKLGNLVLAEGGVATSTRVRRAWRRGGRALHHLLDPESGAPAARGLASVTVLAAEACWAEVLAKAAFVGGAADGARVIRDHGATGLLVHDDGLVDELDGLRAFRPVV
ncbi:MAG: FAD:protein FMN transferase [Actinobacteria bacterium]|nr:FAD:protein FMN transferase [Actinomycetota bacterium]